METTKDTYLEDLFIDEVKPSLNRGGGGSLADVELDFAGVSQTLQVENGKAYTITNCVQLTLALPADMSDLSAHLFVQFADDPNVGIVLPEETTTYGTDPTSVAPGEAWEINIDPSGGILCVGKKVAYESQH